MNEASLPPRQTLDRAPSPTDDRAIMGHVVYGMYAFAAFTAFPAFIGVIIAYLARGPVHGTWLGTHFTWQIRTFWYGLLLNVIGIVTTLILIGWLILGIAWLWFIWRTAKGWIRLSNREPLEDPYSFF